MLNLIRDENRQIIPLFKDRKSNPGLLFYDDFSEGSNVPWIVTAGNGTISRDTTTSLWNTGGATMKYNSGNTSNDATEIHRFISLRSGINVVRFGGIFSTQDANLSYFDLFAGWRDGTNWYFSRIDWNVTNNVFSYQNSGTSGSNNLITAFTYTNIALNSNRGYWHSFEIEIDIINKKQNRLIIDNKSLINVPLGIGMASDTAIPNMMDFAIETGNISSPTASITYFDQFYAYCIN